MNPFIAKEKTKNLLPRMNVFYRMTTLFLKKYSAQRILLQEKGSISIISTFSMVLILSLLGIESLSVITTESRNTVNFTHAIQGQYLAEAGIEYGIKRISQGETPPYSESVSTYGGAFNIVISNQDTVVQLVSTGDVEEAEKTIEVRVDTRWRFAVAAGNDIKFEAGSGTITGDLDANDRVLIAGHTVNGSINEYSSAVDPPTIDWDFFKSEAMAVGQYVTGDHTFTAAGSPYFGVWYITNTVFIEQNVEIYGTVVSENDVKFMGANIEIFATPSNYPALLMQNSDTGHYDNISITGFVYCGNDFVHHGDNFKLTGALYTNTSVDCKGQNKQITLDPNIAMFPVAGVSLHSTLKILSWKEL